MSSRPSRRFVSWAQNMKSFEISAEKIEEALDIGTEGIAYNKTAGT